jgi:adenine phosphoribosyltransferase
MVLKVLLTSCSNLKKEALCKFLSQQKLFTEELELKCFDCTECHLPEQPYGDNCGFFCAKERMNFAKRRLGSFDPYDYVFSIENGIENEEDICFVLIWSPDVGLFAGKSFSIMPNEEYMNELYTLQFIAGHENKKIWGFSQTLGSIIEKYNPGVDAKNWHMLYGKSREEQILSGLVNAHESLNLQTASICNLKKQHRVYSDFPKPNINFVDFMPLFGSPQHSQVLIAHLTNQYRFDDIDYVVGLESRGFILGWALALQLNAGFVPVRKVTQEKKSPLPGKTVSVKYEKEYGSDEFQIQVDAFDKDGLSRVLIIDDLIATGGSIKAACELLRRLQCQIVDVCVLQRIVEAFPADFDIPVTVLFN